MNQQLMFSFDIARCSGCFACVVACLDQNDSTTDQPLRRVVSHEEGTYPDTRIAFISMACFHCGDAPCLNVCPTRALFRREEDGIVALNRDLCVGCHSCMLACPFGAPIFSEDGRMNKCDLCHDRLANDLDPACVHTCPTRALGYGPTESVAGQKARSAAVTLIKSM